MAVKSLPGSYTLNCCIDMEKNKKLAVGLNIGALLIIILLFYTGSFILFPRSGSITISLTSMFILLIGIIFITIIHELVHGLFFKYFSKGKVKYGFKGFYAYASCPDNYFKKKEFLVIGLAPFIILDILMGLLPTVLYSMVYMPCLQFILQVVLEIFMLQ